MAESSPSPARTGDGPDRPVDVPRRRFPGWLDRYRRNHPDAIATRTAADGGPDRVVLDSPDGARASITVPFPPLLTPSAAPPGADDLLSTLLDQVARDRRIGVLLVRRGGHAVGVFAGDRLQTSKIGGGYVQGRTKAGGWSQQRYARRRANQTRAVYQAATDLTVQLLLPELGTLDAVVTGGHHDGVDAVLGDPRLAPLRRLVRPGVIPTPDPRLRVLEEVGARMLDVRITLNARA